MRTRYYVRMAAQQKRGGVRLRQWLKDNRRNQDWLAEQIDTHQTNVSAWILGRPIPLDAAVAIRKITDIPVEDWLVPASESSQMLSADDSGAFGAVVEPRRAASG